ncbi:hypothetical protein UlMin_029627 [Ulmus minor]
MSKFEYPRLARSDIVKILDDAQIATISEHNLLRPNPDFVKDLYTRILISLDFLQEDHDQVEFAALEQLENPDLHLEAIRRMKLFNRIKDVLASLECPKRFNLKDLIKPDPDRTECFISALLNFFLYKETRMEFLSPYVDELTDLEEQCRKWEDKIHELTAEIANLNEAKEKELPLIQEVDLKVKELHQTITGLNNQQMSARASLRKLKEKDKEMDEKISSAEFALVQSVQESANLRSKIIQSPEKLQKALEEKKSVLEEAKNAEKLAMQSYQEKTAMDEVYTKVSKKLKKYLAQMQAIQEQVNSSKSVEKDLKAMKAKISDLEVMDKSLDAQLLDRQGKVEELEKLNKHLEKERDLKCEAATKEYNQVSSEVEARRRDLEARRNNVEVVIAKAKAINLKTASVKEASATEQNQLLLKCEEIVQEYHQYKNSVKEVLKRAKD